MPSKMRRNGIANVGNRIKFYEEKDNSIDQRKLLNGENHLERSDPTASQLGQRSFQSSNLAVYATIDRAAKHRNRVKKALGATPGSGAYQDPSDFHTSGKTTSSSRKQNGKISPEEGTTDTGEDTSGNSSPRREPGLSTQSSKREQIFAKTQHTADKISFRSTTEIENIYQTQKESLKLSPPSLQKNDGSKRSRRRSRRHPEGLQDPADYQWKMIESKSALQRARKSLSNDDGFVESNSDDECLEKLITSSDKSQIKHISDVHEAITKQDSNTSTSSALSHRLLALTEDRKNPTKTNVKRFPPKKIPGTKDSDFTTSSSLSTQKAQGYYENNSSNQKRHTIAAVEYTQADVSPASVRSSRSLILHNTKAEKTTRLSPPSQELQRPNHSPLTQKNFEQSLDRTRDRSPASLQARTTSSSQSSQTKEAQLIFKVDLDNPYGQTGKDDSPYENKPVLRNVREEKVPVMNEKRGIYMPVPKSEGRRSRTREKAKEKKPSKWIQTDGPPIRPPNSRTFATQTEPKHCPSKRLQARPWNLPNYLQNNGTQTTQKATAEIGTQTREKRSKSRSCQTRVRTFKHVDAQTTMPPAKTERGTQAVAAQETTQTQTPDEDSEVWGAGATISLDRLIRNGAIKRSQSIGNGISGSPEKLRDRQLSTDAAFQKETTAAWNNPKQSSPKVSETSGKITTYSWNENGKFVKIFVSYSGIHLVPSKNIQVKTNGINLHLTVDEQVPESDDNDTSNPDAAISSTLYLNRLRRPVSCLSYNVQRDMITIMLRKQKQTPWNALTFGGQIV